MLCSEHCTFTPHSWAQVQQCPPTECRHMVFMESVYTGTQLSLLNVVGTSGLRPQP